jgi:glyoxylase-like metal-dependent hydrolase (beta-lactamase superfamily II)
VIDPGISATDILRRFEELDITCELILITHTHADHIGGIEGIAEALPRVRIAGNHIGAVASPHTSWQIPDDEIIQLGDLEFHALGTPGHTADSLCYAIGGAIFTGDTLFAGSIGRPASSEVYREMLQSIRSKVLSLPDATAIYPGHGPATTVGQEKASNPFF